MVDETDKTLDQPGEPTPDGSISSTWLKPQHNADPQRLSDVLRDITRLVSDWVWEVSPTLKFTYMSPRIFETLGFHPAELRDTTLLDLGTPINQAGDPVSIDWHRPFRAQLFSARNKLNDERLIELSGVPVFDAMSGKFSGVRGTAIDITERRQIEQKLQKARDDAEKVNRQRSTFLHTLSDEIRAPLGVILQAARQMEQADPSRHMSDIQGAGDRLEHLANEILYLAQLEAGQMEFTMEPVAPTAIVDECLHDVEPLAQERNVRILGVHQWDGSIAVDRHRFKQVLLNLITNGIKYNRVGGQLTIATLRGDPRRYRLCVTDEGARIPEHYHDDLFRPFSHLRSPDNDGETGFGLAITKQLVECMHGHIGFSPDNDEGSTFWIEFPAETRIS